MSEDGATAAKDMGGSTMSGMNAQRLVAVQSSMKVREPVESNNYKRLGTDTNLLRQAVTTCTGAPQVAHNPEKVTAFNLQD
jgi:hypothetical protein